MNLKLVAALPLVAVMAAAPAFAGSLGASTSEPEVRAPVLLTPPPVGGLGVGAVVGGVVLVAAIAGALGSSSGTR
jgi:hypothetical protein